LTLKAQAQARDGFTLDRVDPILAKFDGRPRLMQLKARSDACEREWTELSAFRHCSRSCIAPLCRRPNAALTPKNDTGQRSGPGTILSTIIRRL